MKLKWQKKKKIGESAIKRWGFISSSLQYPLGLAEPPSPSPPPAPWPAPSSPLPASSASPRLPIASPLPLSPLKPSWLQVLNFLEFHCLWGLQNFIEQQNKTKHKTLLQGNMMWDLESEELPWGLLWPVAICRCLLSFPVFSSVKQEYLHTSDCSPFTLPNPFVTHCYSSLCSRRTTFTN